MTQHIDPCETARVRVLAAALVLQQCTKTAANIVPIPGTGRFVVIGTPANVAKLLQMASTAPADPDHDPIDELVDVIDVTPQPEPEPLHTEVADSEGGHHD